MADTAAVKEITDRLETGVRELFESDKYAAYLQTMSRFHKYSTRNTLLIHMQYPQATRVAGFASWKQKFNRHVKKGEHGIKIFAPVPFVIKEEQEKIDPVTKQPILDENGQPIVEEYIKTQSARFKIVNVFDIAQTDGEPLPELAETLTGDVERYYLFMDALRAVSPLPMVFEDLPADTDGRCIFGDRIAIRSGMSEIQTVAAAIHEITHAKLHDIETLRLSDEKAVPKDRHTEELEAESVAFSVSAYYSIDTGANSFGYLAEWSRDKELKELNASLDTIRKTAAELIDSIDEQYRVLVKERGIDLSAANASNKVFIEGRDIVAERAAAYMDSSKDLYPRDEADARHACNQCIKRAIDDLVIYTGGEQIMRMYDLYTKDADFKEKLENYIFIKAYVEPMKALEEANADKEADVPPIVAAYARNADASDKPVTGATVLMAPVFINGNFNRDNKKIRVTAEEPIGKYRIYSREENGAKTLYFLTASGMIDNTSRYFREQWSEEQGKWENYRPKESELDELIVRVFEQFGKDLTNPDKWAKYEHGAVLNRITECDPHNAPIREKQEAERKAEVAEAARERQEETRMLEDKFNARVSEIADAIRNGTTINVKNNDSEFNGKNPVLELFKRHGIDLPLRMQGWVKTGLAEITGDNYRYFTGRHQGDSSTFGTYLDKIRDAIKEPQIEKQPVISTEAPVILDMSVPDPLTTVADMNAYGYTHDYMLPMSTGRAVELFDTGHPIYLLYSDNTEAMAIDRDEVRLHKGLCGIEAEDWKASPVYRTQMNIATNAQTEQPMTADNTQVTTPAPEAPPPVPNGAVAAKTTTVINAPKPQQTAQRPASKGKPSLTEMLEEAKRRAEAGRNPAEPGNTKETRE